MTDTDRKQAGTRRLDRIVTMSAWKLLVLVTAAGSVLAILGLGMAAIVFGLFEREPIKPILAIGLILAIMTIVRLGLDLRRHLRISARRRRMARPGDGNADDDEDEDEDE